MAFIVTMVVATAAVGIEMLEALAIVLAGGVERRMRDAVIGALPAVLAVALLVAGVGPALLSGADLSSLRVVVGIGLVLHAPLRRLPETQLKLGVGVALTAFGTFFAAEGLGVEWPLGDAALLYLAMAFATFGGLAARQLSTAPRRRAEAAL